jgi:hypothetical protein
VEQRERALLGRRLKVDEQIAATYKIELRERRIANDIVRSEY